MIVVGYKMSNRGSPARSSHSTQEGGGANDSDAELICMYVAKQTREESRKFSELQIYTRELLLLCTVILFNSQL